MNTDMDAKFVVLTTNRSGSVWLISTLSSLPNVTAQGELFLPRARTGEKRWDSDFACPRFIEAVRDGFEVRPLSVFSYLDTLYRAPGTVGFKLMYAQLRRYPEILAYLIQRRIRVLHLVRLNHLDVVLSYTVKAKTGKAHVLAGQLVPDDISVELDTQTLIRRLKWLQLQQSLARALLNWCGLVHLEVAYEDLLQGHAQFRPIWDFLSLEPTHDMPRSTLVKIRQKGHRQVIRNYDEVRQVMADSEFAGLLE